MRLRRFAAMSAVLGPVLLAACAPTPQPAGSVMVGGAPMLPTRTLVENASNAGDLKNLVAAVKAADLTATLSGPGPFTVFAPYDPAFARLPPGTLGTLLLPENKAKLTALLTYHVVAGKLDTAALDNMMNQNNGVAILKTVQGATLPVTRTGLGYTLQDSQGRIAQIVIPNVNASNGVAHVINAVMLPPG